ncbi:dephospho-CoA kinase [Chryseomicrobium palamuruense]|uniref:Dephospho-CoA kinase n=1 Tax=Chryseomicrobium palamuruense TaxID=682973 RepID=A0ABV8UZF4_9BACL
MIVGLTGSIATGKSTVANRLKELGLPIVDADVVARLVVEPGSKTLTAIHKVFGDEALLSDGSMNREGIGRQIFGDKEKRDKLNAIIHPAIRQEMLRQRDEHVAAGESIVVMDIPLLFESQLQHFVDRILVVGTSEETQIKRLMKRNDFSHEDALQRIQSQIPVREKMDQADDVLLNEGSVQELYEKVDELVATWKAQLSE